jgi:hypothetical protein
LEIPAEGVACEALEECRNIFCPHYFVHQREELCDSWCPRLKRRVRCIEVAAFIID